MKTNVQSTTLDAYHDLEPFLGRRQLEVYLIFQSQKSWNWTNSELARLLGRPINTIVPRVFELREQDLVVEACKRRCEVTGRRVIAWKAKE